MRIAWLLLLNLLCEEVILLCPPSLPADFFLGCSFRKKLVSLTHFRSPRPSFLDASNNLQNVVGYNWQSISRELPAMVATQTVFNNNNADFYDLVASENGVTSSYEVVFIKDTNGLWVIQEF
jgi:hypothetical protein